jgi:hypothetical protein
MNIRWLWLDHIPPELDLTEPQRGEVVKLARDKRRKDPRFRGTQRGARRLLVLTVTPLAILFTFWVFILVHLRLRTQWHILSNLTGILLFHALTWTCIAWAIYRTNAPFVRWALCQINRPVCINCGYILTGADDLNRPCPECGAPREAMTLDHTVAD